MSTVTRIPEFKIKDRVSITVGVSKGALVEIEANVTGIEFIDVKGNPKADVRLYVEAVSRSNRSLLNKDYVYSSKKIKLLYSAQEVQTSVPAPPLRRAGASGPSSEGAPPSLQTVMNGNQREDGPPPAIIQTPTVGIDSRIEGTQEPIQTVTNETETSTEASQEPVQNVTNETEPSTETAQEPFQVVTYETEPSSEATQGSIQTLTHTTESSTDSTETSIQNVSNGIIVIEGQDDSAAQHIESKSNEEVGEPKDEDKEEDEEEPEKGEEDEEARNDSFSPQPASEKETQADLTFMENVNELPLGTRLKIIFTEESGNVVSGVAERIVAAGPVLNNRLMWSIETENGSYASWDTNIGFKALEKLPSAHVKTNRFAFLPSLHAQAKLDDRRIQFTWGSDFNLFSFDDDEACNKLRSNEKKFDGHVYEIVKGAYLIVPLGQQNISRAGSLSDRRICVRLTNFNLKFVKGLSTNDVITANMVSLIGTRQVLDAGNFNARNSYGVAVGQVRYTNMKVPVAVLAILASDNPEESFFNFLVLVSEIEHEFPERGHTYMIPHTSFIPICQESNFSLMPSHLFVVDTVKANAIIQEGLKFLEPSTLKDDDVVFKLARASSSSSSTLFKDHFSSECKAGRKSVVKNSSGCSEKKVLRPTKPKEDTRVHKAAKAASSFAARTVLDLSQAESSDGCERIRQAPKVPSKKKTSHSGGAEERPAKVQIGATSDVNQFEDNLFCPAQPDRPNYRQGAEAALTSDPNILMIAKEHAIIEEKAKNLERLLEHERKASQALLHEKDEAIKKGEDYFAATLVREDLHHQRSLESRNFYSGFAFKAVAACQQPSGICEGQLKSSKQSFLKSSSKRELNCENVEGSDQLFELGRKKLKASEALKHKAGLLEGEQAAALLQRADELKAESESHTTAAIAMMEEEYLM